MAEKYSGFLVTKPSRTPVVSMRSENAGTISLPQILTVTPLRSARRML